MNDLTAFINNPVLVPSVVAWLVAQFIKIFTNYFQKGRFDFARFVGSGGMPSSHSAAVTCAALMTGFVEGFDSAVFGVAVTIAIIVMYDAAGVRLATGKQAKLLNELVENYFKEHYINYHKLKELVGHTPIEVFVGAVLGIVVALLHYFYVYI